MPVSKQNKPDHRSIQVAWPQTRFIGTLALVLVFNIAEVAGVVVVSNT